MGQNFIQMFFQALRPYFSYKSILIIKDLITWLSGIFIGIGLTLLLCSHAWIKHNVKVEDFNNSSMLLVRFKKGKKRVTHIRNPSNLMEALDIALATVALWIRNGKNEVHLYDVKRAKIVFIFLVILGVTFTVFALCFITHPQPYDGVSMIQTLEHI